MMKCDVKYIENSLNDLCNYHKTLCAAIYEMLNNSKTRNISMRKLN